MADSADQRPWIEKLFGPSWQTTVSGGASAVLGILCVLLGWLIDNEELVVLGITVIAGGMGFVGALARSQSAHETDRKEGKT